MQNRSLAALAALTLSGGAVVAWNQLGPLSWGDRLQLVTPNFDASIWYPPDSGPGVPDSGVIDIVLWLSQSYGDPGSNYGPPYYSGVQYCSDDATVCAYRAEDGGVFAAVEPDSGLGITPQVGAIQVLGRALDRPVVLIDRAFPGAFVSAYSTVTMLSDLDDAVSWVNAQGAQARISILTDNSGGYREALNGDPFSTYTTALEVHRTAVNDHIASRIDAGTPGWLPSFSGVRFALNSGTAQQWGPGGISRHPYNGDFVPYTDNLANNAALCGQLYNVETGIDELHPDVAGGIAMADLYGRCWERMIQGTPTRVSASLQGVTMLDSTTLRATFFVPCRAEGVCSDDPPISLNTTAVVGQQTAGNVLTYGFHFYLSGVLQTPGAATAVTPLSCPVPATLCDVEIEFASLPNFDQISYADTAEPNTAVSPTNPRGGGGNFIANINPDAGGTCGDYSPCGDWTVSNVVSVSPFDAGADGGVDGGVDGGPDGGVYTNQYFIESNSGGYLELNPVPAALNLLGDFTVCFAVRNRGTFAPPISRWQAGGAAQEMFWFMGRIGSEWATGIEQGGQGMTVTSPTVVDDQWTHVCLIIAGALSQTWIDGQLATFVVNGPPPNPVTDDGVPLRFLGENPLYSANSDLDSVVFYNAILSQTDMDAHRCVLTNIVGGNPCSGQVLADVQNTTGYVEAYLFDLLGSPETSYSNTLNRNFSAGGSGVNQVASPLP
jgi:hypothetical protein